MAVAAIPLLGAWAQDLPSAEKVIGAHLEAIGGKAAIKKVDSRTLKGTFVLVDMGMEAPIVRYITPSAARFEIEFEGYGSYESGLIDGVAWQVHPMEGAELLEGARKAEYERQIAVARNDLLDWKKFFTKAECRGEETLEDVACYVVAMTPKEGEPINCHFDKKSGLLTHIVGEDDNGYEITTTMSEYKGVEGVKLPHKITNMGGQLSFEIVWESVEVNTDIPAEELSPPEEIKSLMADMETND